MTFSPSEQTACRVLVDLALGEDLGPGGDVTSRAVMPVERWGQALLVARSPGVLAGLEAVRLVCQAVDIRLQFEPLLGDSAKLECGSHAARLMGPVRSLLTAERTALNFLQRLSGVATHDGLVSPRR